MKIRMVVRVDLMMRDGEGWTSSDQIGATRRSKAPLIFAKESPFCVFSLHAVTIHKCHDVSRFASCEAVDAYEFRTSI